MKQLSGDVFLSSTAGLQATTKHSGFPVRMENAVPIVPQAPAAQPLQIQSGVLTQVKQINSIKINRANRNSCHRPEEPGCPAGAGVSAGASPNTPKGYMQISDSVFSFCFVFLEYLKSKLFYITCLPAFRLLV